MNALVIPHSSHKHFKLHLPRKKTNGKINSVIGIPRFHYYALPCRVRKYVYIYTCPFLFFWKNVLTTKTWNPLNAIMSKLSMMENQMIRDSVDLTVEKLRFSRVRKYFCVRAIINHRQYWRKERWRGYIWWTIVPKVYGRCRRGYQNSLSMQQL